MKEKLSEINRLLIENFGIPKRKRKKPNSLDILIGTILSQNTNDKNSFRAYKSLKSKIKSWEEILELKNSTLEKIIKVAGLGKQKATSIKALIKELKKSQGKISLSYLSKYENDAAIEELIKFRGVGVKTASCVLLFSLNRNICPVDTHVHRILNRVGIVKTSSPDKTFYAIKDFIPENSGHSLHTNLLRLGREFCLPKNPKCLICPIEILCNYPNKNFSKTDKKSENNFFLLDKI
ncbi:MAG: endonuclease III [Ignavibacterium sp.]|nr:endonuclease III [Ignavibacterium sp.]MDW8376323.1 endonuclease III [Ignavibacteriales bacterium]